MKEKLAFIYYQPYSQPHHKNQEYLHWEFRIVRFDPNYPTANPRAIISISLQTDREYGHTLRKAYGNRIELHDSWKYNEDLTCKLLKAFRHADNPKEILTIMKQFKARRFLPADVGNAYGIKEWVPARFRHHAKLWWDAWQKGMELRVTPKRKP